MNTISRAALAATIGASAFAQQPKVFESTLAEQTDVAVTVYNNDLALVRDSRTVTLDSGEVQLKFMDVAQQIMPETVSLRGIERPDALHILEQNYEYDLMSPAKLMEKYVGKTVKLTNVDNRLGFTEVSAELLSMNEGPVYKVGNQIHLGHPGNVVLPEIPEELIAKPSLIWMLSAEGTSHKVEATYLTRGVSWKADYVVTLARDESSMAIDAWVTLNNQSGAAYENAQLKLVAGEVNRAPQEEVRMVRREVMMKAASAPAPMVEEAFAEYHLYALPRRTTIKQNQSKQVSLFNAAGIGVKKLYEFRGDLNFYSQRLAPMKDQKVAAFLEFENKEANRLGVPLPAGVMRVYQEDSSGMLQFSGEDRLQHTPKDEKVRLRLGNAFDVVGERVQKDYKVIGGNVFENEFEITVRNHKDSAITVDVVEPMPGDWTIQRSSIPHVKKDAQTAVFSLPVEKDGTVVLTYRVQVKFN